MAPPGGDHIATVLMLCAAHVLEVVVWAAVYALVHAAPEGADLIYFAFVNYATLGYGDIVPVADWRLVGPMASMNGILLFGWSTDPRSCGRPRFCVSGLPGRDSPGRI